MSETTARLEAALRYAAAGVAVFPARLYVRGDGKKGVQPVADWDTASSTDPEVIRGWFTGTWQDAALCIDCGKSGIVGVDQDVTEGKNGRANWAELDPPATWRVRSPTGGAHDYFRADPAHPFTVDNTGAVADGVDIRGMGGFLFAPPSIDPRGGAWQWVEGEPDWAALPMVPEIVIKRMEGAAASRRAKAPARLEQSIERPAGGSQLFSDGESFGPGGGYKTESAARALLTARLEEFLSRTTEGSARSHFLAQDLGVLAGHGAGVFWSYEAALQTLLDAALTNGMTAVHGKAYVEGQARRGLDYGMLQPWSRQAEAVAAVEILPEPAMDAVDALIAEMRKPADIIKQNPPRALIAGLLNLDSESWIIGEPGSKKSFVATDIAAHVSLGRNWQGCRTHQGGVVMIVAEGGGGLGPRLQAWEAQNGVKLSDRIDILTRPVQAARLADWAVLREACRRLAPALVVIDTQARVTVGLEENSAKEMGIYIEAVRAIREATGACVLTVHHTGRRGGDARGSSAIDGAQHTELKVASEKGSLAGKLVSEKQKDMALAGDMELVFKIHDVGVTEDGDRITSLALVSSELEKLAGRSDEPPMAIEPAASVQVREPQDWTWALIPEPGAEHVVRRQLLQAIADLAGEGDGLTWPELRRAVTERWYLERAATSRTKTGIDAQTWSRSCTALESLEIEGLDEPEKALVKTGRRFKINPQTLVTCQ